MQLSTRGRSAVIALVDLAAREQLACASQPVSLAEIAGRQGISPAYLEQLFGRLRRAGLVVSVRGPGGGYCLARPAAQTSIATVVRAVDEGSAQACCLEGHDIADGPTAALWQELCQRIHDFLDAVTLADVVNGKLGVGRPGKPQKAA